MSHSVMEDFFLPSSDGILSSDQAADQERAVDFQPGAELSG